MANTRLKHPRLPATAVPLRAWTTVLVGMLMAALLTAAGCATTPAAAPVAPMKTSIAVAPITTADDHALNATDTAGYPATAVDAPTPDATGDHLVASDTPDETASASDDQPSDERTQAERDFDALYGGPYNPVADPTLPTPAQMPGVYDPWERYNRKMHTFNNAIDRAVARPLARFYVAVTPRPVRLGVSNFFNNLGQPVTAVNALLQGKPGQAAHSLARFVINSTLGIGGIFDPASDAKLDRRKEDFGQTLGVWGWSHSRYVELPLFGPRTVRDVFGILGDAPLSPLRQVEQDKVRIPLQGLQLVDVRTQLLSTDSLREGAADDYALVRDAWTQRRDYQIFGDRMSDDSEDALPDYLRDDDNPQVPASAMPMIPTD